jgi:hypothetical protein
LTKLEINIIMGQVRLKMTNIRVHSEQIRLPKEIAAKLKGKTVKFIQTDQGILMKTVVDPIKSARGVLRGSKFSTAVYLKNKKQDKELEK